MGKNIVTVSFSSILALSLISSATSDLAKDRGNCADQLVGLATCLPYVGGDAKTPTTDCCTGLEQVLKNSKKCLCVLVKDRNDPNLGLKINATLALGLPDKCHAPHADVSKCPALLHLPPNSTDAKVFEDFAKGAKANNTTSNVDADPGKGTNSSLANEKSEGTAVLPLY
ncbi:hypothetical protein LIER_18351 [Lithospermum erythrorhizon]|uniref:Bifunctional inhibitor/plant lipid transfer protein/seed storage helical domain-containing protein n=1 Tax=Lithospermum erythrorhizon TaxID=34254 RepID=A0AAV3QDV2_LITER